MSKRRNFIFILSYFISFLLTIIVLYLNLEERPVPDLVFFLGIVATVTFIVLGIKEVVMTRYLTHREKIMWIISFLFFFIFSGGIYFLIGRKRIFRKKRYSEPRAKTQLL